MEGATYNQATSRRFLLTLLGSLFLLFLVGPEATEAGIFDYDHLMIKSDSRILERFAMWSSLDTPFGSGNASVRVEMDFTKSNHQTTGALDGFFFGLGDLRHIGYRGANPYHRYLCCTPEMAARNSCSEVGRVVYEKDYRSDTFEHRDLVFHAGVTALHWNKTYEVKHSGMHYLLIVNCADSNTGSVVINGTTIWRNPFGYLPGDDWGFLPFYASMVIVYTVTLIAWFVLLALFRSGLLFLQHCITVVVVLGTAEMALLLADTLHYNNNGEISLPLLVSSLTISTLKETLSRLLIISVCMGFGVTRDRLSIPTFIMMGLYGVAYYLLLELSSVSDALQEKTLLPLETAYSVYTFLPLVFLDLIFWVWVFCALSLVLRELRERKEEVKARMYRFLFVTLLLTLLFALTMAFLEVAVLGMFADGAWKVWWLWDSYWHFLYWGVLAVIAIIWRPNKNNTRYAYEQLGTEAPTGGDEDVELDEFEGAEEEDESEAAREVTSTN